MPEDYNKLLTPFQTEKAQAKRVIHDIYGVNTKKSNIMIEKLNECTNVTQITMVLAWGRRNLL